MFVHGGKPSTLHCGSASRRSWLHTQTNVCFPATPMQSIGYLHHMDIHIQKWIWYIYIYMRRKLRIQTSDNMDRWKAEQGRGREKRKIRRKKSRRERVRRKKMQMREKVGKSRSTVFFEWFGAPEGRKVGSLKRRVRSQLARWEMKNCSHCGAKHICKSICTKHINVGPLLAVKMLKKCTLLWREAHFQVKMYKAHHCRTTFGSCNVEKVHAVVARSTFRSQNVQKTPQCRTTFGSSDVEKVHAIVARSTFPRQNVQNTTLSDHFWKLRCRKSARHCGAKHISTSKCTKHLSVGRLLEVQMSKMCTLLWREAHFKVKMLKTLGVRTTFGGSDVASLHYNTLRYTTLHSTTLHNTTTITTQLHSTTLN